MNNHIIKSKSTLPSLPSSSVFGVVGNMVGSYFNYKRDTKLIEHETQKLKEQTKVLLANIDAELQKALDSNSKNFQKEMLRLQSISKELKANRKNKKAILKDISNCVSMLGDSTLSNEVKAHIPQMILALNQSLSELNENGKSHLDAMSSFNPNQKQIKE